MAYGVTLNRKDFFCFYYFLEDKLYHSAYGFTGEHTNNNDYIYDYKELKESLTQKYGKPIYDEVTWGNDLYKSDKQEWGFAISLGHLMYLASWETPTTIIALTLKGDNYKIDLLIVYDSKELKEWAKQIKEKETSKGL